MSFILIYCGLFFLKMFVLFSLLCIVQCERYTCINLWFYIMAFWYQSNPEEIIHLPYILCILCGCSQVTNKCISYKKKYIYSSNFHISYCIRKMRKETFNHKYFKQWLVSLFTILYLDLLSSSNSGWLIAWTSIILFFFL